HTRFSRDWSSDVCSSDLAVSSASLQKTILERDRLSEQVNAFISAVMPSGSDTVATVKNTGSSPVTIDHCLVLSPSDGSLRPAAKIGRASWREEGQEVEGG